MTEGNRAVLPRTGGMARVEMEMDGEIEERGGGEGQGH